MSRLIVRKGSAVVLADFQKEAGEYREPVEGPCDFYLCRTAQGRIEAKSSGGAVFLCIDFESKICEVDVLNWSHVDVGTRKARLSTLDPAGTTTTTTKKRKKITPGVATATTAVEPKMKKMKIEEPTPGVVPLE